MFFNIDLIGCDDHTKVTMDLSPEHVMVLLELARRVNEESYYGCMPKMEIKAYTPEEEE